MCMYVCVVVDYTCCADDAVVRDQSEKKKTLEIVTLKMTVLRKEYFIHSPFLEYMVTERRFYHSNRSMQKKKKKITLPSINKYLGKYLHGRFHLLESTYMSGLL